MVIGDMRKAGAAAPRVIPSRLIGFPIDPCMDLTILTQTDLCGGLYRVLFFTIQHSPALCRTDRNRCVQEQSKLNGDFPVSGESEGRRTRAGDTAEGAQRSLSTRPLQSTGG